MAATCAHCGSADVMAQFNTVICTNCGLHSTDDGKKVLPDSLCFDPSHNPTLAAWGWPYDDTETSVQRGHDICAVQWGVPFAPGGPNMTEEVA